MAEIINGTKSSIKFKVTRQAPELIHPACSTPYESKELSDLDSTNELRLQAPLILFYRNPTSNINPYLRGSDPVKVIKDAIAKALVSYYPLAGRLRETSEGKLVVECNGEGVLFIEADADVTLDDFGHPLYPPFPCSDELLYDVPGSSRILHSPLLLIQQVTRLKCGGFILALRLNHTMADGVGLAQFLNAVTELAGEAQHPSISPVWMRHLLSTPHPSHCRRLSVCDKSNDIQFNKDNEKITSIFPLDDLVHKSFFFGSTEIARLQQSIPSSTTFELIIAHLWRCRTMALYDNPQESVQLRYSMNTRSKYSPSLPAGYYGNVIAIPTAQATVDELSEKPFQYAVDLVKRTKDNVTEEYLNSLANRMAVEGSLVTSAEDFDRLLVADHRRLRVNCLDFGWGRPVYGGYLYGGFDPSLRWFACFTPFKHLRELGVLVPICLPRFAMKKFVKLFSLV